MDINRLIARIKNIVPAAKTEWPVIAAEPGTIPELYKNYIVYVAALAPLATFIGMLLFGIHIPLLGTTHVGFGATLIRMILGYAAAALGTTFVMALIINALAPRFWRHCEACAFRTGKAHALRRYFAMSADNVMCTWISSLTAGTA